MQRDDEIAARAAEAVGGAENPGAVDIRQLLTATRPLFDPGRVSRETFHLGVELLKVLAGASDVEIDPRDRRFRDPTWQENPFYRRLAQAYFAYCRAVARSVSEDLDWRNRERALLLVDVITAGAAPTNMLPGNPEALKRAFETGGHSLLDGARNFLHDLRHNRGMPSQTDPSQWQLGDNIAATPGAVVFRNEILELIQYRPQTTRVYRRPLLLIPPQINKFYFLDLSPGRSFIEYAVQQGMQVFVVSWRNPTPAHRHWNLDSYCEALLEATDAVRSIAGTDDLNTYGFCAGGITMSALLAHLTETGDERVNAASYTVALLDFSEPALIGSLQSPPLLRMAKYRSRRKGIIEGHAMRNLFNWFRPNDLVWNFWVNNYLMGKSPPAFDILVWNNDSTNLPAALHGDFLDIFERNALCRPGGWTALGTPVDLGRVTLDNYVTGAVNDHLTPWKACYRTSHLLGGDSTFALSHAGHIASIVNPPGNPKSSYWIGDKAVAEPEDWFANAEKRQGSWWEHWLEWIRARSGEEVEAPAQLGNNRFPAGEPAPGTYVRQPE